MIISNTVWVSQLKIKPCEKNDTILFMLSGLFDCCLTQLYPGEWRACVSMFDIQWHRGERISHRNVTGPKSNRRRRRRKKMEKKINTSWNWQKYSVYYSVVDTCCQKLHIAMVISKNKMWNTVSYVWSSGSFLFVFFLILGETNDPLWDRKPTWTDFSLWTSVHQSTTLVQTCLFLVLISKR